MRYVTIDCTKLVDEASVHDTFAQALDFPAYYGRNLDALYDLLTSLPEATRIELQGKDIMLKQLGAYGAALLVTLQQAEEAAPNLTLNIF